MVLQPSYSCVNCSSSGSNQWSWKLKLGMGIYGILIIYSSPSLGVKEPLPHAHQYHHHISCSPQYHGLWCRQEGWICKLMVCEQLKCKIICLMNVFFSPAGNKNRYYTQLKLFQKIGENRSLKAIHFPWFPKPQQPFPLPCLASPFFILMHALHFRDQQQGQNNHNGIQRTIPACSKRTLRGPKISKHLIRMISNKVSLLQVWQVACSGILMVHCPFRETPFEILPRSLRTHRRYLSTASRLLWVHHGGEGHLWVSLL